MTQIHRRSVMVGTSAALAGLATRRARAQSAPIRLGVLTDLSSAYADSSGPGSVVATHMAVEDFLATKPGFAVEVVVADMQNKPDVASNIARGWFDRDGVDAVLDMPQSAVALAIASIVREKDKVALFSAPGTAELTGAACTLNTVHWTYDTYALARSVTQGMVAAGGDSWFFISADYAFGKSLEQDAAAFVTKAGGKVIGSVRYPFPNTTDFSSYLLQAQASGAKVVALAMSGSDAVNCLKQAAEFGVGQSGQKIAGLALLITTIHAVGLQVAQGLVLSVPFYWNLTDGTRAFGRRFASQRGGAMPTMNHAGAYASTLHYLKAVAAIGPAAARASGRATVAQMKAIPTDDKLFGHGEVRQDGRVLHDMFVFRVKTPAESKEPWDYYTLLQTVPGSEAFRPMTEGGCKLPA